MLRLARAAFIALSAVAVSSCASTTFTSTWKAPDVARLDLAGKQVAAVVRVRTDGVRRPAEDALARELAALGARAVPAYSLLTDESAVEPAAAQARLRGAGIEWIVSMRVVGTEQVVSYSSGSSPYAGSYWGHGRWGWSVAYDPVSVRTDQIVSIETQIYSLAGDKLVWAGVSESFNPSRVDDVIEELVDAVVEELRDEGLIERKK